MADEEQRQLGTEGEKGREQDSLVIDSSHQKDLSLEELLEPWQLVAETQLQKAPLRYDVSAKKEFNPMAETLPEEDSLYKDTPLEYDRSAPPEEIVALRCILADAGERPDSDLSLTAKVIGKTLRVLRPTGWSLLGVNDEAILTETASTMVEQLKAHAPLTQSVFDACIAACCACGDSNAAIELTKRAPELLEPTGDDTFMRDRVQRTGLMLRNAYNYYDGDLRERVDAVLAGQPAEFKALYQITGGSEGENETSVFLGEADQRLVNRLIDNRDNWYCGQQTTDPHRRRQLIGRRNFDELINLGLIFDGVEDEALKTEFYLAQLVEGEIQRRSQEVVNGTVANGLAGELARRLHPHLGIITQLQYAISRAKGGDAGRTNLANEYRMYWDTDDVNRRKEINMGIKEAVAQDYAHTFYYPEEIGYRYMVGFLHDPARALEQIESQLRSESPASAQRLKQSFGERMIPSLQFLAVLNQDERMRSILSVELGLEEYLSQDKLGTAIEQLKLFLGNEVLTEVTKDAEAQSVVDREYMISLARGTEKKVLELIQEARENAREAARGIQRGVAFDIKHKTDIAQENKERIAQLMDEIGDLSHPIHTIEAKIERVKAQPVRKGILKPWHWLPKVKDWTRMRPDKYWLRRTEEDKERTYQPDAEEVNWRYDQIGQREMEQHMKSAEVDPEDLDILAMQQDQLDILMRALAS